MFHHSLIRTLIVEIRELRSQIEAINQNEELTREVEKKVAQLERKLHWAQLDAEDVRSEADYRKSQQQSALRNLERAKSYGDDWGVARAMKRLKDLQ